MDLNLMRSALRNARIQKKMTLAELAKQADTSIGYVYEIETGVKNPSLNTLEKLTQILGVKVEFEKTE